MSVYVLGCRYKPKAKDAAYQGTATQPGHEVEYSGKPEWVFDVHEAAGMHCEMLNGMRVHVGQHCCQFEVEEFEPGKFAIVCNSHPEA